MSKNRIPVECAECLNQCIIQARNLESISFCPFCGDALVIEFDEDTDGLIDEFSEFSGDDESTDDY